MEDLLLNINSYLGLIASIITIVQFLKKGFEE